jgi:hypothetical protein
MTAEINGAFILAFGKAMGNDFQHFMDEDKTNVFKAPLFFCRNCQDKKTKLTKAINVLQKELNELSLKPSH